MANSPYRRCFACRERDEKNKLLRFVVHSEALVWDDKQLHSGRGAYLHEKASCFKKVIKIESWHRALKVSHINTESFKRLIESFDYLYKGSTL